MKRFPLISVVVLVSTVAALAQARKETLEGVRNFTVVETTVACAGATEAAAMPAIAARGYKAIVNLRLDSEAGAAIEESEAAAKAAGLTFIHLPFDHSAPDMAVADAFIKAVTDPANQPVFIHCASANRAAALWLAKRMLVDKWDEAKALEEAKLIGLTSAPLEKFALDYVAARKKAPGVVR
jgi:uncharacterized protein (TIGR01244 family)